MPKVFNRAIKIDGKAVEVNEIELQILQYDGDSKILLATGTTVPTADSSGFAKGCLFIKTDAADGTKGLYENQGTTSESDFNLIGDISSAELSFTDGQFIKDGSGNELLMFGVASSAVNYFKMTNTAASSGPTLSVLGTDADIDLNLVAKGKGSVTIAQPTAAAASDEAVAMMFNYTSAQTYLTGSSMIYSGGRGSAAIELLNTWTPTTGGFSNIFSQVTSSGVVATGGNGVINIKAVTINSAAITNGVMYGAQFIAKKTGSGTATAESAHIGVEGWFYETDDGVLRTGIGGNFGYHIDSTANDHGAGSVHRGVQIFLDDGGSSQAEESTGLCIWNMAGAQHNAINIVNSASGFTNFVKFTDDGAPAQDSGTVTGSQAGWIKVLVGESTCYIPLYPDVT